MVTPGGLCWRTTGSTGGDLLGWSGSWLPGSNAIRSRWRRWVVPGGMGCETEERRAAICRE